MKIDSPNPNTPQLSGVPGPQDRVELTKAGQTQQAEKVAAPEGEAPKSRAAAAAAGAAPDSAQISSLSQLLRTQTEDTPERQSYLARLEQQVASGEYNPNPADIARGIVDDITKA